MPFDLSPAETTADPFTLEAFATWLEREGLRTKFDYGDIHDCVLCRYLRARGLNILNVGGFEYNLMDGSGGELPADFAAVVLDEKTYGGVLRNIARALLAQERGNG